MTGLIDPKDLGDEIPHCFPAFFPDPFLLIGLRPSSSPSATNEHFPAGHSGKRDAERPLAYFNNDPESHTGSARAKFYAYPHDRA